MHALHVIEKPGGREILCYPPIATDQAGASRATFGKKF